MISEHRLPAPLSAVCLLSVLVTLPVAVDLRRSYVWMITRPGRT